jgi:aminoglycoside 6'-N-acetyltransferase I
LEAHLVRCVTADRRWVACRAELWPEETPASLQVDAERPITGCFPFAAWLALVGEDVAGFAEVLLRIDPVNGCETSPVAFLEGLWVGLPYRRRGIARQLIGAAEDFARSLGCLEFASDALVGNIPSHAVHIATGFAETERVVCFRKRLLI